MIGAGAQSDMPVFLMQGAVNYLPSKDNIIIQTKVCGKGAVDMEKEMEGKDEASTTNATEEGPDAAGGLPELSRFERHWAENPNQKSWAFKNMSAGVGHVWHMDDMGLVLQVASEDTMRLLTVVDHDYCRKMVSFVKATLESLDLNLDTSQAITRPYSGGAAKPDAASGPKDQGPPAWRWSECARTPATGPSPCGARPATSTGGRTRTTPAATPRHASASWRGQRRQRGSTWSS